MSPCNVSNRGFCPPLEISVVIPFTATMPSSLSVNLPSNGVLLPLKVFYSITDSKAANSRQDHSYLVLDLPQTGRTNFGPNFPICE